MYSIVCLLQVVCKKRIAGIQFITFDDIPAGNLWFQVVRGIEACDIDSVLTTLDLFTKDIDALVIVCSDRTVATND